MSSVVEVAGPRPWRRRDVRVRLMWGLIDTAIVGAMVHAATFFRTDFDTDTPFRAETFAFALAAGLAHAVLGATVGPYAVGHTRGSFEEVVDLGRTVVMWSAALFVANVLLPDQLVPRSVPLSSGAFALLVMLGVRYVIRSARSRRRGGEAGRRSLVFGAGEGGAQLVRALVRDPACGYLPVGILDDAPHKRRLRIDGVRVLGGRKDIAAAAERTDATHLLIAIPSAGSELIREVGGIAEDAGLEVLVLPTAGEMLGRPGAADLRSLDLHDLLGRKPVTLDEATIASSIQGKTVLVTGAGGSIGAELCRQIHRFGPAELLMLDRDESALHTTQLSVTGKGLFDGDDVILADIRDAERMHEVFREHRPDIVFHAAALKHLPLLEQFPEEAWKTNVLGTLNVLEAAYAHGVQTFVNISTDKAANPSCVLGYSKRLTERLTAHFASLDENVYVSVRFGNVLGSRGSVLTAFTAQIEQGGPVTVTHPDVERYFMLIPEACQLVLQAAAIGKDGDVMVLDMGEPAKIDDVARTLVKRSGRRDIDIVYTGLRPGEKMSEELFTPGEEIQPTVHPLVSSVPVPALVPEEAAARIFPDPTAAARWMRREATPQPSGETPAEVVR